MTGKLLARGLLVGLFAAVLSFGYLKVVGEPWVDISIAFENAADEAKSKPDMAANGLAATSRLPNQPPSQTTSPQSEPELVSRSVQAGIGLLTGVAIYSTAFGGLFALAFALAYRRMGDFGPRTTSALLAVAGFVSVYLTPMLKYPANPPSVGLPETIDMRTSLYFAMILISLAVMIAAGMVRRRLNRWFDEGTAALVAAGVYIAVMTCVALALPDVNEVPEGFPATVLWKFRIAALGGQLVMWATLGLLFGVLAERVVVEQQPRRQAVA